MSSEYCGCFMDQTSQKTEQKFYLEEQADWGYGSKAPKRRTRNYFEAFFTVKCKQHCFKKTIIRFLKNFSNLFPMSNTSCYWPPSALRFIECRIWMSAWRNRGEADLIMIKWQYSLMLKLSCVSGRQAHVQTASSLTWKSLDVFDFSWAKATLQSISSCYRPLKTQVCKIPESLTLNPGSWCEPASAHSCFATRSSHSTSLLGSATVREASDDETRLTVG